jgi:glutaredoxin
MLLRVTIRTVGWALVVAALGACHRHDVAGEAGVTVTAEGAGELGTAPRVPFDVRPDSTDVSFFWFDEHGAAHPASRVEDVPSERRERVRVDPARPELREPGWVYVADLRAPGRDGRFAVRAIASEALANELASINGLAQAMAAPPPAPAGTAPSVPSVLAPTAPPPGAPTGAAPGSQHARITIYGAEWCSACHQAANYLRSQNIPFVEHDIEHEPAAAQEMYARARQQGVPTGSIPIIDIDGRLMVGFNPGAIQQALRGG